VVLEELVKKVSFTAEPQRTQRERRGLTNISVILCGSAVNWFSYIELFIIG
jgi:hypothetical protein